VLFLIVYNPPTEAIKEGSMAAPKVQAREGIKLDKGTAGKLDKKRFLKTSKEEGQVTGQYRYAAWVRCPYCGELGHADFLDTNIYVTVWCWSCHEAFLA
jgi:hypothetical protein